MTCRNKYVECVKSLSIFLFHSWLSLRPVSHSPLSYVSHFQLAGRWKRLSIVVTHRQRKSSKIEVSFSQFSYWSNFIGPFGRSLFLCFIMPLRVVDNDDAAQFKRWSWSRNLHYVNKTRNGTTTLTSVKDILRCRIAQKQAQQNKKLVLKPLHNSTLTS